MLLQVQDTIRDLAVLAQRHSITAMAVPTQAAPDMARATSVVVEEVPIMEATLLQATIHPET